MIEKARQVGVFVERKIVGLASNPSPSAVKAQLAHLRNGVGKLPGSQPALWEVTLSELPESLISQGEAPTQGEWAIHVALTLYSLHQQGRDPLNQNMNHRGNTLGHSARQLREGNTDKADAVRRRFNIVAMADSFERLSWHLRGFVQLLKASSIPLDYCKLAEELYWYQFAEARDGIRLKWGQDFYRTDVSRDKEAGPQQE
ncbi:MAG: type I-E CRISPR-associated protein Cse2/CasB [Firmicutes bacterium]|nr:type I-E CRISPR-associated protein Cse2/CasB [Dethiobacter sp.]MBS3888433.1 type I-E CRISPR-associated protein Cse2/CasB [Bacillota bacterium]MBS4054572.1 type I-E CRISPR-associated protein Cse2/CasB [Thermaerobacter sp.]